MSTAREPIRVLYVDDSDVADAAATYLERLDDRLDVVTASGAREGWETVSEGEIDCVVSAYELPDSDGIELLERVREERPQLPFFLVRDIDENGASVTEDASAAGVTHSFQRRAGTGQYDRLARRIVDAGTRERTPQPDEHAEQYLREFAESADIVFWAFDREWTSLEFVTSVYETIYGQPRAALRDRPRALLEAVHPDDRDKVREAMGRAADGEPVEVSHRVDETAGYRRWVHVQIEPIADEGEVVRIVGCSREITDQKKREEELKRQNDRLSDFASVVSHDLRNPLNVAEGRLELARQEVDSEHLDAVSRAHGRMETLIEDILTLAQQGKTVTETQTVDLARSLERCWPSAERGEAALVVETDQLIRADEGRLQQLLDNLVRNAIEHAGEDVTVTVGPLDDGFYVADDGPGIPEDQRDQVFESGYSTAEDGTGFGLSIVREIAEAHGWSIAVTDSDAGGARFDITGVEVETTREAGERNESGVERESPSS